MKRFGLDVMQCNALLVKRGKETENSGVEGDKSGDSDTQEIESLESYTDQEENNMIEEEEPIHLYNMRLLNIRKSEQKNLLSLKELSLACVSNNIGYFACMQDPFESLPAELLLSVSEKLKAEGLISIPSVVPLLLTAFTSVIHVDLECYKDLKTLKLMGLPTRWTSSQISKLFDRIMEKCKGDKVRELHLSLAHREHRLLRENGDLDPVPSLPSLYSLLKGLGSKLTELTLHRATIGDLTLSLIARTCLNLSKLDVSGNEDVTDFGITLLSATLPGPVGEDAVAGNLMLCQQLTHLNVVDTCVSDVGLALALHKLPMLTHLEHIDINKGISKFIELYEGQEIKLQTLHVSPDIKPIFEALANIMKCIKVLKIECGRMNLTPLLDLNCLTDLKINCCNQFNPSSQVMSLITNNINLTRLNIQHLRFEIDISLIGHVCLNLEEFIWKNNQQPSLNCEHDDLNDGYFSKLKYLQLVFANNYNQFPSNALINMLSSPCLEKVTINKLYLEDNTVTCLVDKARTQGLVFSNLHTLNLVESTFFYPNLRDIICVSPKLKELHVSHPGNFNPGFDEVRALAEVCQFDLVVVFGYPRYNY